MTSVAVIGASGTIGGEMLRILLGHPRISKVQAISRSLAGKSIAAAHPNLREYSHVEFINPDDVARCDVVFFSLPHGSSSIEHSLWKNFAPLVIDLSSDFRMKDPRANDQYYGRTHELPGKLDDFVPGIPEYFRGEFKSAKRIVVPGCAALASILAIKPLTDRGLIGPVIFIDAKVGANGLDQQANANGIYPERAGVSGKFMPGEHRHEVDVAAICKARAYINISNTDTGRGTFIAAYSELSSYLTDAELRTIYHETYGEEPFTRTVKETAGANALPDAKQLFGTNYCDVGFATTHDQKCIIAFAALDNLIKGSAGNAVHCMNISLGYDERAGLNVKSLQLA